MIVAIIQARMSSQRLPGKVLMDISGKPMLQHIIDRVNEAKLINDIVIATTTKEEDKSIIQLIADNGMKGYRGSELDVLDRYYQTVARYKRIGRTSNINTIVRITSDCPLIDPRIIDKTIEFYLNGNFDYVSNVETYPDGLDTEVFSYNALAKTWKEAKEPRDREHVTSYICSHPKKFKVGLLESGQDFSKYKWSVDTIEDLEFARTIYRKLGNKFYMEDILKLLEFH